MATRSLRLVGLCFLIGMALVSCRSDTSVTTVEPSAVPAEPTSSPPAPTLAPANTPEPAATPGTTPAATAPPSTPPPTATPDLAGEPWDLFVPAEGESVAVVGVAFDDTLEVHQAPGENTPLIGTLAPIATDVVSAGEGRQLPNSIWWRITRGDLDGWVGSRFMSRLGLTADITSDIVASLGTRPAAETMLDLGMIVAEQRASDDPPSLVVVSVAPTVGDLGEITIDVVGIPDDAVQGERLHIFGQPLESGEGFSLMAVEATVMCRRGVTDDGLCL